MDATWNFTPSNYNTGREYQNFNNWYAQAKESVILPKVEDLKFRKITHSDMSLIWDFLLKESGRTTDFSYGGVLMWIDYFKYEYAIINDTLFIKGTLENDCNKPAFSLPIGKMKLKDSVALLRDYCDINQIPLYFSAIPEYAINEFKNLDPRKIDKLDEWSDYLYEAESLATLQGKKNGKKRNHVNKFISSYPGWELVKMTSDNSDQALHFMDKFDLEGDDTQMAIEERKLTRFLINCIKSGDDNLIGVMLKAEGNICAISIGDIKRDTFYVHVEKALREFQGSYEMINKEFASFITENNPQIKYINREDDAGDEGLRKAKLSYHPLMMLDKYNVYF